MEYTDDTALGDDDGDGAHFLRNRRRRQMAASESEREINVLAGCVEITTRGHKRSGFRDHEGAIELGQLFDRAAQIRIGDVRARRCVSRQRIEYERSRRRKYCFSVTEGEERADAAAFTTFASNLECQLHRRLENSQLAPRDLATQLLQNRDAHRAPASC